MSHDMHIGHGIGMDPRAMARDMRNRFWIALLFTIPVLLLSPMAGFAIAIADIVRATQQGRLSGYGDWASM
jgi:hypothetical protein